MFQWHQAFFRSVTFVGLVICLSALCYKGRDETFESGT